MRSTVGKLSTLLALGTLSATPRGVVGQRRGVGTAASDDDASIAYCEEDGSSAHYDEVLSGSGSTMMRWAASNTGCPNHVNWDLNPNPAQHNAMNTSIPAYPMLIASGGTTDLSSTANAVGIMRNGVVMFSSWARDQVLTYEDTAFYLESDTFDLCGGHATAEGTYHYHNTAGCLQEQAALAAGTSADEHSALLGWAFDGFPIYGQRGPDGVEMKMCNLDGANPTACLDVCSGYEALLPEVDDFAYRYYTSCGFDESFFPFTTNCFRGCCPDGVSCSRKVEACGTSPERGYTDDYVPSRTTSLDEQYDTDLIEGDDTDFIDTMTSVDCSLFMGAGSVTTTPKSSTSSTQQDDSNDDSEYVEVGTKTTVDAAATSYDGNPGVDFGNTGCGTDGCLPALAHDSDSSTLESRWSCSIPDGGVCVVTFTFGDPVDLKNVQVAFYKGEERTRWLKIGINGDEIGTFESYIGSTFNSFDIEETGVESVTMEAVGITTGEWIALLEVRFMVKA